MRIAMLGLGFMGSTHLKAWHTVSGFELAAVCSENDQKLSGDLTSVQGNLGGAGERYDFSQVARYRDWQEAVQDPGVDVVDICLPTHLHAPAAMAALKAGKDVLVEKPIALDGPSADALLTEAEKQGRILMSAQVLRFVPAYRALKEQLPDGRTQVKTAVFRRRCASPFWSKWLADEAKSGGGAFDLLIHDVDFAIQLLGLPEAVSATGAEELNEGVDTVNAVLFYRDVSSVLITGGWHHPKSFPFSMEYTVVSEAGTYEFSSGSAAGVKLHRRDGEMEDVPLPAEDAFEAELRYFHQCCMERIPPAFCPPAESAQAVKLMLQILESRKLKGEKIVCRF